MPNLFINFIKNYPYQPLCIYVISATFFYSISIIFISHFIKITPYYIMEKLQINGKFLSYNLFALRGESYFGNYWEAYEEKTYNRVIIKFGNDQLNSILQYESEIFKEIQPSKYFPKYYGHGTEQGIPYLILEDFGDTLALFRLTRKQKGLCTSFYKIGRIGIKMLKSLREFHELGFVHRNISPYSFVFKRFDDYKVFLIDLSLSRRWRSPEGKKYLPRNNVGLRGVPKYASISSHEGKDLGRVDDLWSFYYILIELFAPVPWENINDKEEIYQMKKKCHNNKLIYMNLPKQFQMLFDYLDSLDFADDPNYDLIIDLLGEMAYDNEKDDIPFDEEDKYVSFDSYPPVYEPVQEEYWSEASQPVQDESQNNSQQVKDELQDSHPEGCCLIF